MVAAAKLGFFGKLPMRGDFVSRNMETGFRSALEDWLHKSLAESKKELGRDWMELYLTAPLWRFIIGPGVCGPDAAVGLFMPSVDKVGRYYPLVLAATMPDCRAPSRLFRSANRWFKEVEAIGLSALDEENTFEAFEAAVTALGPPDIDEGDDSDFDPTSMQIGENAEIDKAYTIILDKLVAGEHSDFSLWWTGGSDRVEATLLFSPGMPEVRKFCAFLDGNWRAWNWRVARPISAAGIATRPGFVEDKKADPRAYGHGASHPGTVRDDNQDSWLALDACQIFCVADGVGGHDQGEYASRLLIETLAKIKAQTNFQESLKAVLRAVQQTHELCLRRGRSLGSGRIVATTMTALVVGDQRYALVWAGDSRAYHIIDGEMMRISNDHVEEETGYLIKAVGANELVEPDVRIGTVREGDRFLLVSDGISKTLPIEEIEELLQDRDAEHATRALLESALIAGAVDNITALVIDLEQSGERSAGAVSKGLAH